MIKTRDEVESACQARGIPPHMWGGVERYLFDRLEGGSFFMAVVSNDLVQSMARADIENRNAIHGWAGLLYNDFPGSAHGSAEKVKRWLNPEGDDDAD